MANISSFLLAIFLLYELINIRRTNNRLGRLILVRLLTLKKESAIYDIDSNQNELIKTENEERKPLGSLERQRRDTSESEKSETTENAILLEMGDEYRTILSISENEQIIGTKGEKNWC